MRSVLLLVAALSVTAHPTHPPPPPPPPSAPPPPPNYTPHLASPSAFTSYDAAASSIARAANGSGFAHFDDWGVLTTYDAQGQAIAHGVVSWPAAVKQFQALGGWHPPPQHAGFDDDARGRIAAAMREKKEQGQEGWPRPPFDCRGGGKAGTEHGPQIEDLGPTPTGSGSETGSSSESETGSKEGTASETGSEVETASETGSETETSAATEAGSETEFTAWSSFSTESESQAWSTESESRASSTESETQTSTTNSSAESSSTTSPPVITSSTTSQTVLTDTIKPPALPSPKHIPDYCYNTPCNSDADCTKKGCNATCLMRSKYFFLSCSG